jgi:hypothetical protein
MHCPAAAQRGHSRKAAPSLCQPEQKRMSGDEQELYDRKNHTQRISTGTRILRFVRCGQRKSNAQIYALFYGKFRITDIKEKQLTFLT